MGMDSVELILRTEEFYGISISDEEAASVITVGDFYILICGKIGISALESPTTPSQLPILTEWVKSALIFKRGISLPPSAELLPWSSKTVWDSLIAIFVDQLQIKPADVTYRAKIADDLGVC